MSSTISLAFVICLQWLSVCVASDSQAQNDREYDIRYRCERSILELPAGGIGGLFTIATTPHDNLDKLEIISVRQEFHDLWGSEEIESQSWFFSKPIVESSSIVSNFLWNTSSSEYCYVKVWSCVRNFQGINCPVGSIWCFWSNVTIPSLMVSQLESNLSGWCDQFSQVEELASREILLVAYGNGVFPALKVSEWFMKKNEEKNVKVIFFNPPDVLVKDLATLPHKGLLMGLSKNEENAHNIAIAGPLKNKKEVMRLYEVEKASTISALSVHLDTSQGYFVYNPAPRLLTLGVATVATIYFWFPSVRGQFESFSHFIWRSCVNDQK